jgi:hypothetical protein
MGWVTLGASYGQQKPVPAGAASPSAPSDYILKVLTPELTRPQWYRYMGVGVNMLGGSILRPNGQWSFERNEWYTLGKGNYFVDVMGASMSNRQRLLWDDGYVTIQSQPSPEAIGGDATKLHIDYSLTLPVTVQQGLAYLTLSVNSPLPAAKVGQKVRILFWVKGSLVRASTPRLMETGAVGTFGGDIFSEQFARPVLSYRPPKHIRTLSSYEIETASTHIKIGPDRLDEIMPKLKTLRRQHAEDSLKGTASRIGFEATDTWRKVVSPGYTLDQNDINSKTISFEVVMEFPFTNLNVKNWDNIDGTLDFTGFQWWLE